MVKLNKLVLLKAKKLIKNEEHQTHVQYKDLTCIVQFINDKQEGHVRLFPHKYVFKINSKLKPHHNSYVIIKNDAQANPNLDLYTFGVIVAFLPEDNEFKPTAHVYNTLPLASSIIHYRRGYSPLQNISDISEWDKFQELKNKFSK